MKSAIQICSELEWEATKSILKIRDGKLHHQPFGEYFRYPIGPQEFIVYQSGATKTRSAAACQFAINRWRPDVVVNLGTCGGVSDKIRKLDIIMASKTFQYDVIQRFGNPSVSFKGDLKTNLDMSWVDLGRVSTEIYVGTIASADQDLPFKCRRELQKEGALTADWESASIARVCELNRIRCLILRGVTDIPEKKKKTKENIQERDYKKNTRIIMAHLFSIISQIVFR